MAGAAAANDSAWSEDEPMGDEAKKLEEPDVGLNEGTVPTKWLDGILSGIPGANVPDRLG